MPTVVGVPGSTDHHLLLQEHIRQTTNARTGAEQFHGIFYGLIKSLLPNAGFVEVVVPQYNPGMSWNAPYPPTPIVEPKVGVVLWPGSMPVTDTLCVVGFVSVITGTFGQGVTTALPAGLNCVVLAIYPNVQAAMTPGAQPVTTAAPTSSYKQTKSAQGVIQEAITGGAQSSPFIPPPNSTAPKPIIPLPFAP